MAKVNLTGNSIRINDGDFIGVAKFDGARQRGDKISIRFNGSESLEFDGDSQVYFSGELFEGEPWEVVKKIADLYLNPEGADTVEEDIAEE